MPLLALDGDTLGEKHKHFNKLVQDAIADEQYELRNISDEDSDIDNLLKINIASKTRNVEYIIQVMKSKDMLYAATAIKKSTWLVTEAQYARIINPKYLHTKLLPSMNPKTFKKLMLHIRLHLKDEKRVQTFYEYLKHTDDGAYKWLQNCSIPFIENVIKNERLIPLSLFKRLCRRSAHFIKYYTRVTSFQKKEILCWLKSHTSDVLNILEEQGYNQNMGKKKTNFVMKRCPERILANFRLYSFIVDLSVVAKYLNKKDIKSFLHSQTRNFCFVWATNSFRDNLKPFIWNMPEEERFEFVKKTFIDKIDMSFLFNDEGEKEWFEADILIPYQWYEYAPFHVALPELESLIRKESAPGERCAMLSVLITCAKRNPEHIRELINYYTEKHINEAYIYKLQFVTNLLSEVSTHEFDVDTWNVLDKLFHSMELYTESDYELIKLQMCLQSILTYKVLHDEPIPDIIKQKIQLGLLKKKHLNEEQEKKVFSYLLNSMMENIQSKELTNESEFNYNVGQLTNVLILLRDWKKNVNDYPFILEKIHDLVKIKQDNSWFHLNLSSLYLTKKSWRKPMFHDSLSLCLSEDTCLNALKHNPQLLTRHDIEIDTLRTDDAVSLRRLLAKLRVYWPHSLAQQWTDAYLLNLNKPTGQKAVVRGLFSLLPQIKVIELAKKHAPSDPKVTWGETDPTEIRIRKNIANYLHFARPLVPLDTVLWYAKGDYLQHAVPSLNSISHNLSEIESREFLSELLDAPVSLQKYGVHLAFLKLKTDDLKTLFSEIWDRTKNCSIQAILFKHTYVKMCKVKNPTDERKLWELLRLFIDKLGKSGGNGVIPGMFKTLTNIEKVPDSVRPEYYMKMYEYLASLPDSANCEKYVKALINYAPDIMEKLEDDFVAEKLLSPAEEKFGRGAFMESFASYVLCGKTDEGQLGRFRRVIRPAMKQAFECWGNKDSEEKIEIFLNALVRKFKKYFTYNRIDVPVRLFAEIRDMMVYELPLLENYILITSWKLISEYVFSLGERTNFVNRSMTNKTEDQWKDIIHGGVCPLFGVAIVKCLKDDIEQFSAAIHSLFSYAIVRADLMINFSAEFMIETLKHMLFDEKCIPSYLVVSKTTPTSYYEELKPIRSVIRNKLKSHPSLTVQVHYNCDFEGIPED